MVPIKFQRKYFFKTSRDFHKSSSSRIISCINSNECFVFKMKYFLFATGAATIIYCVNRKCIFRNKCDSSRSNGNIRYLNYRIESVYESINYFTNTQKIKFQNILSDLFWKFIVTSHSPLLTDVGVSLNSKTDNIADDFNIMKIGFFKEKANHDSMEAQMFDLQSKYAKERETLESEIKELRRQILLNRINDEKKYPTMKKSLIEMYSEVLDELSTNDSNYTAQDHLPRVVVVGEQSAGKTSVLEMVAQARLFPRGSGTMMTRAPVKVTLSEGPFAVAKFDGEGPEFDLSTENGQSLLRSEIERRMNELAAKTTISKQPISLSVRGPNLHRLVLVDLPGVINTVTAGMHADAKDAVYSLAKQYMSNPNAIILCIQDGSKDAESSSIVDLVSSMDPLGKRTIFVLTKVDLAETQMSNPSRVRDILSGKVFHMKALGYFAVIAGKGNKDESISDVKAYEEKYFETSRLFRDGAFHQHNLSTENLSKAVSDKFWAMVEEAVEQQCDVYKALRFNLETEWKHKFKGIRELDRMELFEKARGEILDNLLKFSNIDGNTWQDQLSECLWDHIKDELFETIFIPANQLSGSSGSYQTTVDIKLKNWVEGSLPSQSIDVGESEFVKQLTEIERANESKSEDPVLFKSLKKETYEEVLSKYRWDMKARPALKVIQSEALSDAAIKSKSDWDTAVKFLIKALEDQLNRTTKFKDSLRGPGVVSSWLTWSSKSETQRKRSIVMDELYKVLHIDQKHKLNLASDEITSIRRNMQLRKVEVDAEFIKETWNVVYREHLYQNSLKSGKDSFKGYYYYQNDLIEGSGNDYRDVTLFWRISKMLQASASALRMQIMNNENRRLEKIMKNVLDDVMLDEDKLNRLITGDRAKLAEELKRIRRIQEKLEIFTQALKSKERP